MEQTITKTKVIHPTTLIGICLIVFSTSLHILLTVTKNWIILFCFICGISLYGFLTGVEKLIEYKIKEIKN